MARYVLVSFSNDAEAEAFVQTLQAGQDATMTVEAVWKKPTLFCECPDPGDKSVLGQKYNWRVHAACGRPKKGMWQNPRNLLYPDERLVLRQIMLHAREPRIAPS